MKIVTEEFSKIETLEALFNQAPTVDYFMISLWMFWVESVTLNLTEFQMVLASKKVNKWFLMELKKEEKECANLLIKYTNITQKDKNKLYIKCIYKLFSRFPSALLQEAKKRETKKSKVPGIKINFSIVNLN